MFLIYSNQEYNCRLSRKVYFCISPLSYIQTSKIVLITVIMSKSTCANNYRKCVNPLSANPTELFQYVWPFCGVGA